MTDHLGLASSPTALKIKISRETRREDAFYQSAWECLLPYITHIARLIEKTPAGESDEASSESSRSTTPDHKSIPFHSPELMMELLPSIAFLSSDVQHDSHIPTHINSLESGFTKEEGVKEIMNVFRCFNPESADLSSSAGSSLYGDREGAVMGQGYGLDRKWLLGREMLVREAFGCTYFRILLDSSN